MTKDRSTQPTLTLNWPSSRGGLRYIAGNTIRPWLRKSFRPLVGMMDGTRKTCFSLFFDEARSFVEEVMGREEYWWLPEATGVITFWLKEFRGRLPQWRPVFWDMLGSEGRKSWKTMGLGLAQEVISWAKELDQSELNRRSAFDFRAEDPRDPWEPKETMKELALIKFRGPG